MTNAFELTCPACKSGGLDIQAHVWVRLTEDGTDADAAHDGNHEWDESSRYRCRGCPQQGRVAGLKREDRP